MPHGMVGKNKVGALEPDTGISLESLQSTADTGPHQHCAFIWSESEAPWADSVSCPWVIGTGKLD